MNGAIVKRMKLLVWGLSLVVSSVVSAEVIIGIDAQTKWTDSLLVVSTAGIKTGDHYDLANVQEAIRRVYRLGLYKQIEVDTTRIGDGIKLVFRAQEFPYLKELQIAGNKKIRLKDLKEKLKVKEGEILSDKKIFDWQKEIEKLYKDKGYILAKITSDLTPPDEKNRSILRLIIDEGEKVRIKQIEIEGNSAVSDGAIKKHLKNKQRGFLRSGGFNADEFKKDLERIVEFYKERGYIEAVVEDYDLKYDGGWVFITIKVKEGREYYLGTITFTGDSAIIEDTLRTALKIRTGQIYNLKKVNETLSELYSLYGEEGYIYAQIVPVEELRQDSVDVKYEIAESRPARIRRVLIEGNERTHDKVIRRQIVTMPGSIFKRSEVIRSLRDIFNLGFFESPPDIDYKKTNDSGDIDLIYRVKEKMAGNVGAGATYGAQDGLAGYVELSTPNLFGQAEQLYLHLEKGGKKTNAVIGITKPWLFDTPLWGGIDLSYVTQTLDYYNKHDRGGGINFSFPLPLDFSKSLINFEVSNIRISDIASSYEPVGTYNARADTIPKWTISTRVTLIRDSRDYNINPSSGSYLLYLVEPAYRFWQGNRSPYFKQIFEARIYYPLFWKFVLMLKARFGAVDGFPASGIPFYERFYPGGIGTAGTLGSLGDDGIRGYPDRSIGPRVGGYNAGGRALAIFSLEYKLKLSPSVAFVAFADAGNTWESFRSLNLSDLKRGAGVGVRLDLPAPLGLIGFDLGYGFDRSPRGFEPHFMMGRSF
jgi:outer membrane protein insertion porin family